eukprot:5223560-Pyramimonas_sp.AAC.1
MERALGVAVVPPQIHPLPKAAQDQIHDDQVEGGPQAEHQARVAHGDLQPIHQVLTEDGPQVDGPEQA